MASIQKRRNGYRVRIQRKGHPVVSATLPTRALAERWAHKVEIEVAERRFFGDSYRITLDELITQYLQREAPLRFKYSTHCTAESALKHWSAALGRKLIAHVKSRDLLDARDGFLKTMRPATVNRMMANLSAVFSYAVEREYVSVNPCSKVRNLPTPPRRERVLGKIDRIRLEIELMSLDRLTWLTFRFAIETGARKSEILGIREGDYDPDRLTVVFRDTKNGSDREIPISKRWHNVLSEPGFRFKFKQNVWEKAKANANITDLRFHDLRHTFITGKIAEGVPPMHVAAMVGHSSQTMVQYYTHLKPEDLRSMVKD